MPKEVAQLSEHQKITSNSSRTEAIYKVALDLRESILSSKDSMSWPPKQSEPTVDAVRIPDSVRAFLSTLLTGNTEPQKLCSQRVQRLLNSFAQDLDFGVTCGRVKTPKHILLTCAVKSLTNNVELIQIINRCGHGVSYSQIVLKLLSCQCKRRCQWPNCTCLSNGLQCKDLCRLQDCENRHEDPTQAIAEIDDDEDH